MVFYYYSTNPVLAGSLNLRPRNCAFPKTRKAFGPRHVRTNFCRRIKKESVRGTKARLVCPDIISPSFSPPRPLESHRATLKMLFPEPLNFYFNIRTAKKHGNHPRAKVGDGRACFDLYRFETRYRGLPPGIPRLLNRSINPYRSNDIYR